MEGKRKAVYKQHYVNTVFKCRWVDFWIRGNNIIHDTKAQVICLTETKLTSSIANDPLGFENYNLWRKDRVIKQEGRVIISTTDKLQASNIPPPTRTWDKDETRNW